VNTAHRLKFHAQLLTTRNPRRIFAASVVDSSKIYFPIDSNGYRVFAEIFSFSAEFSLDRVMNKASQIGEGESVAEERLETLLTERDIRYQCLLNEHQVAQFLNVSVASVRRWRLFSQGPRYLKIGTSSVRYRPEDVSEWLKSRPAGGSNSDRIEPQS
jgi:predicted DNA-binding transcriptional regulator AlpA